MVMKRTVVNSIGQIGLRKDRSVACIGFFDGLHLGHQALINETMKLAKEKHLTSMLITFNPDPWSVIHKKSSVKHITPLKRKLELLEEMGFDEVVILKFDQNFSSLSPEDFVYKVLMGLGINDLVVGDDFKFGSKGKGDVHLLQREFQHVLSTHVIDIQYDEKIKIGSTQVTQTILNGKVDKTAELLGRYYRISGIVVDGAKQGREIGFPTANLHIYDEFVLPKVGVYAGYTIVQGIRYKSIVNIGYNPTINTQEEVAIETHILDFDAQIYGEVIHQEFVFRIRDELKFDSLEELIEQMKEDEKLARKNLK